MPLYVSMWSCLSCLSSPKQVSSSSEEITKGNRIIQSLHQTSKEAKAR